MVYGIIFFLKRIGGIVVNLFLVVSIVFLLEPENEKHQILVVLFFKLVTSKLSEETSHAKETFSPEHNAPVDNSCSFALSRVFAEIVPNFS